MTHPEMLRTDTQTEGSSPLLRSTTNRKIAGIAGGLGEYFGVDPILFRVAFVVLAIGGGSGILIYLVMWLIVPERVDGSPAPQSGPKPFTAAAVLGMVFILVGTIALLNSFAPHLGQYFWPVTFVIGGLALVMGGLSK